MIHARGLLHFFFDDKKHKPTDLLACDFVVDPTAWRAAHPKPSKLLEDFKLRADTEVAHVTTLRKVGQPPQKAWDVPAILNELKNTMKDFVDHANHPPAPIPAGAPPSPSHALVFPPGAVGSSLPLPFSVSGATGATQSCAGIAEVIRKL